MSPREGRFDLHQTITDKIVEAIERVSAEDFRLPWHRTGLGSMQPKNALTKNPYRGINVVSLWVAAEVANYPHALWAQLQTVAGTRRAGKEGREVFTHRLLQGVRR